MNGVLVIDKPQGMTSFDIVRQVRRMCKVRRVGHAGTLDPLATGVLPVAVGWSTRLVEYMMAGDKRYQATMQLGASTDTKDSVGDIEQLPPMYSALKKDGKPLYKLARQGIEVERKLRPVHIASLVIDDFAPPLVTFTVHCTKGTYVRTLCHDIGQKLNCGAHMTALRRLSCGTFNTSVSHTLEELQEMAGQGKALPFLTPAEVLADWPALTVAGDVLGRLQDGVAPAMADLDVSGLVAGDRVCFLAEDALVAVAHFAPGGHGKRPGDFEIIKVFPLDVAGA